MKEELIDLIQKLSSQKVMNLEQSLTRDLRLDSVSLVQVAVNVHEKFGVDIGEKVDQGHKIETVGDILNCLSN